MPKLSVFHQTNVRRTTCFLKILGAWVWIVLHPVQIHAKAFILRDRTIHVRHIQAAAENATDSENTEPHTIVISRNELVYSAPAQLGQLALKDDQDRLTGTIKVNRRSLGFYEFLEDGKEILRLELLHNGIILDQAQQKVAHTLIRRHAGLILTYQIRQKNTLLATATRASTTDENLPWTITGDNPYLPLLAARILYDEMSLAPASNGIPNLIQSQLFLATLGTIGAGWMLYTFTHSACPTDNHQLPDSRSLLVILQEAIDTSENLLAKKWSAEQSQQPAVQELRTHIEKGLPIFRQALLEIQKIRCSLHLASHPLSLSKTENSESWAVLESLKNPKLSTSQGQLSLEQQSQVQEWLEKAFEHWQAIQQSYQQAITRKPSTQGQALEVSH